MNLPLMPSTHGQTIEFNRVLFKELLQAGYSEPHIFTLSLTKALLARYGSAQEIDEAVGEGTFWGVQQAYGAKATWRKAWSQVRKEQKAKYVNKMTALDTLKFSTEWCRDAGVSDAEIINRVRMHLKPA